MTLQSSAKQLINDIGKALTLRQVTEGSYDPATGALSGGSNTDTSVKGMVLMFKDNQFDGDLIQRGDRKIVLRASDSVVPKNNDIIIDGSDQYRLIEVRQVEEAGTDVIYTCQGRI